MLLSTRSVRISAIALFFTAILGFALPASAGNDVPLQGIAFAQIVGVVPGPDGIEVTINATGHATHLGNYTRTEEAVVHADGSVTGWVDFVAANGDHLTADIVGGFINATDVAGSYLITGGSGRFEDAEGEAVFLATSPDGVNYTVLFNGTVDY